MTIFTQDDKVVAMPTGHGPVALGLSAPAGTGVALTVGQVPAGGTLQAGARTLRAGDAIDAAEMGQLTFTPGAEPGTGTVVIRAASGGETDTLVASVHVVSAEASDGLYFRANDGTSGVEVWRATSDGTLERVADIAPGADSSQALRFTDLGTGVWFQADDGVSGTEPWRVGTDGTLGMVADIVPGEGGSFPHEFVRLGADTFFAADTAAGATELFRIGADGALVQMTDMAGVPGGADPRDLIVHDGALYFSAVDAEGRARAVARHRGRRRGAHRRHRARGRGRRPGRHVRARGRVVVRPPPTTGSGRICGAWTTARR